MRCQSYKNVNFIWKIFKKNFVWFFSIFLYKFFNDITLIEIILHEMRQCQKINRETLNFAILIQYTEHSKKQKNIKFHFAKFTKKSFNWIKNNNYQFYLCLHRQWIFYIIRYYSVRSLVFCGFSAMVLYFFYPQFFKSLWTWTEFKNGWFPRSTACSKEMLIWTPSYI